MIYGNGPVVHGRTIDGRTKKCVLIVGAALCRAEAAHNAVQQGQCCERTGERWRL